MAEVLERSYATLQINALANHPLIRPEIGGDPKLPLDLSEVIDCDRNVCLMGEHGGFVYIWTGPYTYEVHTIIDMEGRGQWALNAARESINHMADNHGARHIWTRVAATQRNVRSFTINAGLKPCGQDVFDFGNGPTVYNLYEWRVV